MTHSLRIAAKDPKFRDRNRNVDERNLFGIFWSPLELQRSALESPLDRVGGYDELTYPRFIRWFHERVYRMTVRRHFYGHGHSTEFFPIAAVTI